MIKTVCIVTNIDDSFCLFHSKSVYFNQLFLCIILIKIDIVSWINIKLFCYKTSSIKILLQSVIHKLYYLLTKYIEKSRLRSCLSTLNLLHFSFKKIKKIFPSYYLENTPIIKFWKDIANHHLFYLVRKGKNYRKK